MTKYDDGNDDVDNDGNEYINNNDNAAARSGSNGTIFDPIMMPRSCLSLVEEDRAMTDMVLWPWKTMYLRFVL